MVKGEPSLGGVVMDRRAKESPTGNLKQSSTKRRKENMKRTHNTLIAALAGLALSVLAGTAQAQYKPTGDDGITASPKLREQLDQRRARTTLGAAVAPSMACPKCKDAWVSQPDNSRGAGARTLLGQNTKLVARHQCGGCGVDWSIAGTGKGKHAVASHKCSGCGAEDSACCSPKGSGTVATRGMGQPVQIAPLK